MDLVAATAGGVEKGKDEEDMVVGGVRGESRRMRSSTKRAFSVEGRQCDAVELLPCEKEKWERRREEGRDRLEEAISFF